VGYRLAEVLPLKLAAKQEMLEIDDPVSRLQVIRKFLVQQGLL
jgi:Lon protease-like protein